MAQPRRKKLKLSPEHAATMANVIVPMAANIRLLSDAQIKQRMLSLWTRCMDLQTNQWVGLAEALFGVCTPTMLSSATQRNAGIASKCFHPDEVKNAEIMYMDADPMSFRAHRPLLPFLPVWSIRYLPAETPLYLLLTGNGLLTDTRILVQWICQQECPDIDVQTRNSLEKDLLRLQDNGAKVHATFVFRGWKSNKKDIGICSILALLEPVFAENYDIECLCPVGGYIDQIRRASANYENTMRLFEFMSTSDYYHQSTMWSRLLCIVYLTTHPDPPYDPLHMNPPPQAIELVLLECVLKAALTNCTNTKCEQIFGNTESVIGAVLSQSVDYFGRDRNEPQPDIGVFLAGQFAPDNK